MLNINVNWIKRIQIIIKNRLDVFLTLDEIYSCRIIVFSGENLRRLMSERSLINQGLIIRRNYENQTVTGHIGCF